MNGFHYDTSDASGTDVLGHVLAELLPDGTTVALYGTLGAGKTRLVQAIAAAAGVERREVISPTFVLVQEYHGRRSLCHIDAYRLRDEDEFEQLGPDEFLESDAVTLIEWADRIAGCLPKQRVEIEIEITGSHARRFRITAVGDRYVPVVAACEKRLRQ